jgi:hypothetical protein
MLSSGEAPSLMVVVMAAMEKAQVQCMCLFLRFMIDYFTNEAWDNALDGAGGGQPNLLVKKQVMLVGEGGSGMEVGLDMVEVGNAGCWWASFM